MSKKKRKKRKKDTKGGHAAAIGGIMNHLRLKNFRANTLNPDKRKRKKKHFKGWENEAE